MSFTVLLETIHGSRLYGTYNKNSDYDIYIVGSKYNSQVIDGSQDNISISLDSFLHQIDKGVPQALEALYSPVKTVDSKYKSFFDSLSPNYSSTINTFRRTIKHIDSGNKDLSFCDQSHKRKMHRLRLINELNNFYKFGRFNPILSQEELLLFTSVSKSTEEEYNSFIREFTIIDIELDG